MTSIPYFPMYPADFEADTSHLTLEEDGAYNRLLRLMWMTPGCSLPDDAAWITRRMRITADDFARVVSPLIAEFFRREEGRVFSPRLMREWVKASETCKKRSEAGKRGGRPKAIENKQEHVKPGLSREKAGPKQPEPEPEPIKKGTRAREILMEVVSEETAEAFLAHRKAKRATVTERAAQLIAKDLRGIPNADDVVNNSIKNGWTGVFPDRTPPPASPQDSQLDKYKRIARRA